MTPEEIKGYVSETEKADADSCELDEEELGNVSGGACIMLPYYVAQWVLRMMGH